MDRKQWTKSTDNASAKARAGGRAALNKRRRKRMWQRRFYLLKLVNDWEVIPHGFQAAMARKLGVKPCVISKDMQWVLANRMPGFQVRCWLRGRAVTVQGTGILPIWMRRKRELEKLWRALQRQEQQTLSHSLK